MEENSLSLPTLEEGNMKPALYGQSIEI